MNEEIRLQQVNNGYIVFPNANYTNTVVDNSQINVFQSFAELVIWLENHFTSRNCDVKSDVPAALDTLSNLERQIFNV